MKKMETTRLEVQGMTCDGCVRHVREALEGLPGVEAADVSLEDGAATVRTSDEAPSADDLLRAVKDAAYSARTAPQDVDGTVSDGAAPSERREPSGPLVAKAGAGPDGDDRPHLLVVARDRRPSPGRFVPPSWGPGSPWSNEAPSAAPA